MQPPSGRLWSTICDGQIEIRSLTEDKLEESLDVLDGSFFLYEMVSIGSEINLPENVQARKDLRELSRITSEDGVSLIAIEKATGKPIAVSFNKIQYIPENGDDVFFLKFRKEKAKSSQAQSLMDYMIEADAAYDVLEKLNLQCTCELMFMATLPEWGQKGIAKALAKHSIELAKELKDGIGLERLHPSLQGRRPQAVTVLWTSNYSQNVGKAVGFKVLNTIPYTHFKYNGKTFAERIGPIHKDSQQAIYML
uniref:N-acetyltransferase domain-containing protein n=1 Tax=Stomoxys calcitrans TaxID=35570 RepID=A0A1I8PTA4_STOCA